MYLEICCLQRELSCMHCSLGARLPCTAASPRFALGGRAANSVKAEDRRRPETNPVSIGLASLIRDPEKDPLERFCAGRDPNPPATAPRFTRKPHPTRSAAAEHRYEVSSSRRLASSQFCPSNSSNGRSGSPSSRQRAFTLHRDGSILGRGARADRTALSRPHS